MTEKGLAVDYRLIMPSNFCYGQFKNAKNFFLSQSKTIKALNDFLTTFPLLYSYLFFKAMISTLGIIIIFISTATKQRKHWE